MHRRHEKRNIPTELLRALVTVVDTGSFTKAAGALDLTQSAISAQIRRLGHLLGGSMFARGPGIAPTRRGLLALKYARRILAINDELLASAGSGPAARQIVIGLPTWLGNQWLTSTFEQCLGSATAEHITFRCDHCERLVSDLHSGSLDIAFLCNVQDSWPNALAQWLERTFWVKSPRLALCSGAPIPLVGWPGSAPQQMAVEAMQKEGLQFYMSFSAPDLAARLVAVASGLGVIAIPERLLGAGLEIIHDGMPPLPGIKTGLFAREGLDLRRVEALLQKLKEALAPPHSIEGNVSRPVQFLPPRPNNRQNASAAVAK